MRVLEKCGFVREAVHRNAITKNGIVMDEVVYVRFREKRDWLNREYRAAKDFIDDGSGTHIERKGACNNAGYACHGMDQVNAGQVCSHKQHHQNEDCCEGDLQEPVHLQGADKKPENQKTPDGEKCCEIHCGWCRCKTKRRQNRDGRKGYPEEPEAPEGDHPEGIVLLPLHDANDELGKSAIEQRHRDDGTCQISYSGIVETEQNRGRPECTETEWCRIGGVVHQEEIVSVLFVDIVHKIFTFSKKWCTTSPDW
ncbi:hypothetical protein SDC9_23560 [bioreactor metagenome]|uniref:Uncharacterized protein n=1 Tax=bioreactor metagenome TaxID=1076179 RepID=A0A644UFU3_9ZZZZ